MDTKAVGNQIAVLRKQKDLTQAELGDRLGVTFQAVSKWERGETLPDTALLLDLAEVLETTVDTILMGGQQAIAFRGKIAVSQMDQGLRCLAQMGELLGKSNPIYRHAIDGINNGMNTDIESAFQDRYCFEAFMAEAILQNLRNGYYIDLTDVRNSFVHPHFGEMVLEACRKHGIK